MKKMITCEYKNIFFNTCIKKERKKRVGIKIVGVMNREQEYLNGEYETVSL